MRGESDNQGAVFHTVQIEDPVPTDHPLRRIRELCAPLRCANNGHSSIPPEQLFLAMLGGYLMGVRSDRNLIWKTISGRKAEKKGEPRDEDRGNPSVDFKGEKRSNATHRSTTDPDARIATKSGKEAVVPAYTVNGVMENRNRILVGIGVETFRGAISERDGALNLLDRARKRLKLKPQSLGADKGYFA
ncbi:MAG: hypothetical protein A2049_02045 [Elusimicrobia bacterium GWA2_62_23]|nr:MAG: hypothetical protein A2049_02045 [Elusimicrobia bacterium GWA2_62_23]OGR72117.1 MAG: hypothetical protein A2179_02070 [Elusimicrobia bacterium GWC2_63_65]